MKVPKDMESWLQGYWLRKAGDFWALAGSGGLEAFTLWHTYSQDRTAHELAHLVLCRDEDIWSPVWGVPEFAFFEDSDGRHAPLSPEAHLLELEIQIVERIISRHTLCEGPEDYWRTPEITAFWIADSVHEIGQMPRWLCEQEAERLLPKWDIEKIWTELNRKYRLIDAELVSQ